ncbi:MAG: hypothetical protein JNM63_08615, partial [Spirochaetia bacterium]|nr:hypothetical protein [Spirochaetia bacterium]
IGEAASSTLNNYPVNHGFFLQALLTLETPCQEITLVGSRSELPQFLERIRRHPHTNRLVLFKEPDAKSESACFEVGYRKEMKNAGGKMTAYVCEDKACAAPIAEAGEFERLLAKRR